MIGELFDKQRELSQYVNADASGLKLVCSVASGQNAEPIIDRIYFDALDYVIGSVERAQNRYDVDDEIVI